MQLKAAIERAVRFCPRGKNAPATLQAVRLVSAYGDFPPMIYSTAGMIGVLITVEEQLPNALIPVDALRKLVKASKSVDVIEEDSPGTFRFTVTAKGSGEEMTYNVDGGDLETFPSYPGIPLDSRFEEVEQWGEVSKVLYAAGKDSNRPDFQVVHFSPNYVLATDGNKIAQADVILGHSGFVPIDVFRGWPKSSVMLAWTETYAFFRMGAETRFAALQADADRHGKASRVVTGDMPSSVLVNTKQLAETVARALDVSPWGMVAFDFSEERLTVRAFQRDREADAEAIFSAEIAYASRPPDTPNRELLVNGKFMAETMKSVSTPSVRLRFGGAEDALKLDSGWLRLSLLPHPWGEVPKQ